MLLFTNRARQVIDVAVKGLPDERSRLLWAAWAKENSQLRKPGGITHDDMPPPDHAVVAVVVSALEGLQASMRERMRAPELSDDQLSDLESDLTYVADLSYLWRTIPAH